MELTEGPVYLMSYLDGVIYVPLDTSELLKWPGLSKMLHQLEAYYRTQGYPRQRELTKA